MRSKFENKCLGCGADTGNPKFCSRSCAAKVNNKISPKRKKSVEKEVLCINCGSELGRRGKYYCSSTCSAQHRSFLIYKSWLEGTEEGLSAIGTLKKGIKDWLRKERGDQCEKCGWSEVNPFTGVVPIEANHKDGNYRNNRPENIELICPNCHSLTSSYRAANAGMGREWRR